MPRKHKQCGKYMETYDSDLDPEYNPDSDASSESEILADTVVCKKKKAKRPDVTPISHGSNSSQSLYPPDPVINSQSSVLEKQSTNSNKLSSDTGSIKSSESSLPSCSGIKRKYVRKKDLCYFCETDVQNFVRHIKRNHSCEPEVAGIFSKPAKDPERRKLLANLKKKGNFIKNAQSCIKPVKEAVFPDKSYLPCSNCLGFYRSKFLYRHTKKCLGTMKNSNCQSKGQDLLIVNRAIDKRLKDDVFPRMRADKISLVAKNDFLICAFGARYIKLHREKHFINVASRKMRELSRIFLELKKREPSLSNLFEALQPKYYDLLVEAAKSVARFDSSKEIFLSPTYAMNIATSFKQCCDIALYMISKRDPTVETASYEAGLRSMISLITANWKFDISSSAATDLHINKYNKITIIPLASDLKLLKDYLVSKAEASINILSANNHSVESYIILLETIFCRVILLNRRRPGELQRMLVHTYESIDSKNETYQEFDEAVSETEKMLIKFFKRVVIRGKRGRGVPVMFSKDIQTHIRELLNVRSNFLLESNPYLFGKPGTNTPIIGYKVLSKYAKQCGAKNPEAITCTRLRKHLATLTQLFNLNENEIEQLSTFMGHTPGVHRNNYRLPDDVYQTAKISKLLLLMEKGEAGRQKGKTLDDINVNLEEDLLDDAQSSGEEQPEDNNAEEQNIEIHIPPKRVIIQEETNKEKSQPIKRGKIRTLVPWTNQQKNAVESFFASHISRKQAVKRSECNQLKELYPDLLQNKDWLKIKVYVQNKYSKK